MKPRGKAIYSINEGNAALFDDSVTKYLESIKYPKVSFPWKFIATINSTRNSSTNDLVGGLVAGWVCGWVGGSMG